MSSREQLNNDENFIHNKYGYCYYAWDKKSPAIIFNLFVYEPFRKRGYARKMLQNVINEIRLLGYNGIIEIEAKPKQKGIDIIRLINFYKKMKLKVINI